jgi:hypothetical protein
MAEQQKECCAKEDNRVVLITAGGTAFPGRHKKPLVRKVAETEEPKFPPGWWEQTQQMFKGM